MDRWVRADLAPAMPDTGASLRGLSGAEDGALWATGSGGTVLRSTDGGRSWALRPVPGGEGLDLRDVEAFGAEQAVVMAAGPGEASRLFLTEDGGATWTETLRNPDPDGFFDGLAFWNRHSGLLLGDPVDGAFAVWRSADGGRSWQRIRADGLRAVEGEHGFAASGTGIAVHGSRRAWFVTGGTVARAFRSEDGGRSWQVSPLPLAQGRPSAGGFGVAFPGPRRGVAVGGDYLDPESGAGTLAVTRDGGRSWTAVEPGLGGYRSGVLALGLGGSFPDEVLAIGPNGGESFAPALAERATVSVTGHSVAVCGATWPNVWISGPDGLVTPIHGTSE